MNWSKEWNAGIPPVWPKPDSATAVNAIWGKHTMINVERND